MRALLDTHAFLWWSGDDPQLSVPARQAVAASENEVYVSAASAWEIAIKMALGRLRAPADLEGFFAEEMRRSAFRPLCMHVGHGLAVRALPDHHRDPFDRILVAQAQIERVPIVTADPMISRYGVETIW